MMTAESRRLAGILLVVFPSVVYGGASLLMFLLNPNSGYMANPCGRICSAQAMRTPVCCSCFRW